MRTGRPGIIAICLIIIISACQLVPVESYAAEYFDSHNTAKSLQLSQNPLHNSVTAFDNSSSRQIFQRLPIRKLDGSIYRNGLILQTRTETVIPDQLADIRGMIRETISQYFNGSKYKACHLKI